jgi:hypothetical protein
MSISNPCPAAAPAPPPDHPRRPAARAGHRRPRRPSGPFTDRRRAGAHSAAHRRLTDPAKWERCSRRWRFTPATPRPRPDSTPDMLEILTSDALMPLRHGFFGRKGGASSGCFEGLNCGPGSSDQAEAWRSTAPAWPGDGVATRSLVTLHQVHSPDVVTRDRTPATRPRPMPWSPPPPALRWAC